MKNLAQFLIVSILIGIVVSVSIEEDLTLTSKQKQVLDEFKQLVKGRLPQDYMYDDIYLIRWLRARNFNLKNAETMLMQNIAWRKENRMDKILDEDWSDFKKRFKYWIDGVDKDGRPIIFMDIGEWDVRKTVIAGQGDKIFRFIDYAYEDFNRKLRNMRKEGKAVTQYYAIYDMDGFNLVQQGCAACIPYITHLVTTAEMHFPGNSHKTVLINTPGVFQPILQILKSLMSPRLRDAFFVYGRKEDGSDVLLNDIDEDQLAEDLGGTRFITNYSS